MRKILAKLRELCRDERGGVFAEYILLVTIVGLGAIVGIAVLRSALIDELAQLSHAISQIILLP